MSDLVGRVLHSFVIVLATLATAASASVADEPSPRYVAGVDGVTLPELLKKEKPPSPSLFRRGIEAKIFYDVVIAKDGSVNTIKTLSCMTKSPEEAEFSKEPQDRCVPFDEAARAALQRWRYKPSMKDGVAVDAHFTVLMTFKRG